jgi:hypothetical protein
MLLASLVITVYCPHAVLQVLSEPLVNWTVPSHVALITAVLQTLSAPSFERIILPRVALPRVVLQVLSGSLVNWQCELLYNTSLCTA